MGSVKFLPILRQKVDWPSLVQVTEVITSAGSLRVQRPCQYMQDSFPQNFTQTSSSYIDFTLPFDVFLEQSRGQYTCPMYGLALNDHLLSQHLEQLGISLHPVFIKEIRGLSSGI